MQYYIDTWRYSGDIYRIINCPKNKIKYNGLICSWSKNYESFAEFNHVSSNMKYSFLIANTGNNIGFDVNLYGESFSINNHCIKHEHEIIFPLKKKYIKDVFYGTVNEFIKYMNGDN